MQSSRKQKSSKQQQNRTNKKLPDSYVAPPGLAYYGPTPITYDPVPYTEYAVTVPKTLRPKGRKNSLPNASVSPPSISSGTSTPVSAPSEPEYAVVMHNGRARYHEPDTGVFLDDEPDAPPLPPQPNNLDESDSEAEPEPEATSSPVQTPNSEEEFSYDAFKDSIVGFDKSKLKHTETKVTKRIPPDSIPEINGD